MRSSAAIPALLLSLSLVHPLVAANAPNVTSPLPKRGLIYIATDHESDYGVFHEPSSPLTWYYNYSPWPSRDLTSWTVDFLPMIHGTTDAATDVDMLKSILNGSAGIPLANGDSEPGNRITHVLSFNEPDGDTKSGGSDSSPEHAAQVYLDILAPLREAPYHLSLSLPSTTGSEGGLKWLHDFNASCYALNPMQGCPFDFVATHWYGNFDGLTSWLGQIHSRYPDSEIWLTEFAIPGADDAASEAMLTQSLPYLDRTDYVARYAWFGTFREGSANKWTGDGVSMLDGQGKLTSLGADYMGGAETGFHAGMGQDNNASGANGSHGRRWGMGWMAALSVAVAFYVACI